MEVHTMSEFLWILFQVVLVPAVPVLLKILYNFVVSYTAEKSEKIENEKVRGYVNDAVKAVMTAVTSTFQTYVDSLKKQGKFDEEAQKIAFNTARDTALLLLTQDMRDAVTTVYGDFDTWLAKTIEQFVLANKEGNTDAIVLALTA